LRIGVGLAASSSMAAVRAASRPARPADAVVELVFGFMAATSQP
jgi:hypothetical protein